MKMNPSAIDPGHVAGKKPAVAEKAAGFVRVVPISQRDVLAGGDDFADFVAAGPYRRAVCLEHLQSRAGQALADRAELIVQQFGRQVTQPGRGLGLTVHHKQPNLRKRLADLLNEGIGQFAPGLLEPAQRRETIAGRNAFA